jgi:hypothetical protein
VISQKAFVQHCAKAFFMQLLREARIAAKHHLALGLLQKVIQAI